MTTTAETADSPPADRRDLECDLIMKGGIASGIVYPQAVLALKDRYRFRCIGGTSAGAIAAAAAAAAEFRRRTDRADPDAGFRGLARLNRDLCAAHTLRDLFQPAPRTRALMEVASAAMQADPPGPARSKPARVAAKVGGVAVALARHTTWELGAGALAGAAAGEGLFRAAGGTAGWGRRAPLLALAGLTGAAAGGGWALLHKLFADVPANNFGLCSGHDDDPQALPIIDWLIDRIEGIGGKAGGPLTFGDLQAEGVGLELKLMTTNLSEEMPYVLPLPQEAGFLFCEAEMRDLFPQTVVDHLTRSGREIALAPGGPAAAPGDCRGREGNRFFFLPPPEDMPVVVTMRMSLSFPVLLGAVPLYKLAMTGADKARRGQALTGDDLTRHLFSDGGLCSNFPIHFFDSWLPTRPTFGIDLTPLPQGMFDAATTDAAGRKQQTVKASLVAAHAEAGPGSGDGGTPPAPPARVVLPKPDVVPVRTVNPVTSLAGFLGAIVSTMQNYRDNQQAELPSYRERIVQVRLAKNEGGLNLDMPAPVLDEIADLGAQAAQALEDGFSLPGHQWTRLLVLMGQMEEELCEMSARLADGRFPAKALLADQQADAFPFGNADAAWCRNVQERLDGLQALVSGLSHREGAGDLSAWAPPVFRDDSLAPPASLRVTPRLYTPDTAGKGAGR